MNSGLDMECGDHFNLRPALSLVKQCKGIITIQNKISMLLKRHKSFIYLKTNFYSLKIIRKVTVKVTLYIIWKEKVLKLIKNSFYRI